MAAAACKVCDEPLIVVIEAEQEGDETVSYPDDLQLQCKCRFHWQCLLDQFEEILSAMTCPTCKSPLRTSPTPAAGAASSSASSSFAPTDPQYPAAILTTYTNEGGVQHDINILPDLQEEAYVVAHPELRPARAMHVLCAEGDVEAVVELLQNVDREFTGNDVVGQLAGMIRYQDPFAAGVTGLHVAVENLNEEVVWLLLWIASELPTDEFPEQARRDAEAIGLGRSTAAVGDDIRYIESDDGLTPGDMARNIGGVWAPLLSRGIFGN